MQLTQTAMAKTGVQIARMVEKIQSPHRLKYIDEVIKLGTNALVFLGHGFHHLCLRRRELIEPEIDPKYHGLFSPTVKHTEFLFGGNLQEKICSSDCGK